MYYSSKELFLIILKKTQNAISFLNTIISAISSKAAGTIATAVSDITTIKTIIPRNCSLGNK
jgi:hypothetical protein